MAGNRYAAAYHALYECIRSLIVIRDLARLEPTADMVSHVTSLHDMLWKGRDALAVELNHVLPALTAISASPVEICGETGTCVHDAVFRLADATLMNLLAAGGNAETASWGLGPDNWGRLREAVAHLDPTELKRAEVEARREALLADDSAGRAMPEARHSPDYRSVLWYGAQYSFTPTQAVCVKFLWEAWEQGTPDVGEATIVTAIDENEDEADCRRLSDVFGRGKKQHPAWGKMIKSGATKGTYRLAGPEI